MFDALSSNMFVTKVSLGSTGIDDASVAALSLALVDNQAISDLSLRDNRITSEGCEYLLGTLDSNTTISAVDLSGNDIRTELMNEIGEIMSSRSSPMSREAYSPAANDVSLSRLLQRVKSNDSTLTELLLDNRELAYEPELEALFDALAQNNTVTKISLANNEIDNSLVAALSLALVDNRTITHLILSDNHITSEGCEYLLGTLDSNTTVLHIDLAGNTGIDSDLMDEIKLINSSRNSDVDRGSNIGGANAIDLSKPPMHEVPEESDAELAKRRAIMAVMRDASIPWPEKNKRILALQQEFYDPGDENEGMAAVEDDARTIQRFIDRVSDNDRQIVEIVLDGQELGRDDEMALFKALAKNTRVKSLSLVNCRISNDGAAELADALRQNATLSHINLEDNQITSNAALDFITCLKEDNDTVQYLELKDNRVRSGLLSQLRNLLEKRQPGYKGPEPVVAEAVATASYAQVAPVTMDPKDGDSARSSRGSRGSKGTRSGKSKSKSSRDRSHRSGRRER